MRVPIRTAKKSIPPKGKWREFLLIIGIDPGVRTGFAIYYPHNKQATTVEELEIWEVFARLNAYAFRTDVLVILEDARKNYRPKFETDKGSEARKMGAGWIRTLSGVIERSLQAYKIHYITKRKGITKISAGVFKQLTGIETTAGQHNARDAGMMVWQHPSRIYVESNGF